MRWSCAQIGIMHRTHMWRVFLSNFLVALVLLGVFYTYSGHKWQKILADDFEVREKIQRSRAVASEAAVAAAHAENEAAEAKKRAAALTQAIAVQAVRVQSVAAEVTRRTGRPPTLTGAAWSCSPAPCGNDQASRELTAQQAELTAMQQKAKEDDEIERKARELVATNISLRTQADQEVIDMEKQRQSLSQKARQFQTMIAVMTVMLILSINVAVVFALHQMGALKVNTTIVFKRWGGRISIAGAGLVGCFLALVTVSFMGLYLMNWLNR